MASTPGTDGGDLSSLRQRIDSVDQKLVALLNERASISVAVGRVKAEAAAAETRAAAAAAGGAVAADESASGEGAGDSGAVVAPPQVYIPRREREVLAKVVGMNQGPLRNEAVVAIYREIMSASLALQQDVAVAFLGPAGTHSHQATLERFGDSVLALPQPTIPDVFTAVEQGRATYGVVPFENSTHGAVAQTLDRFISSPLEIKTESYLVVHHHLMSLSSLHAIRRVYSHPEAFAQCRQFLDTHLGHAELIPVNSTAHAAEISAKEPAAAALCNAVCASLYGLQVVAPNVETAEGNTTRFLVVSRPSPGSPRDVVGVAPPAASVDSRAMDVESEPGSEAAAGVDAIGICDKTLLCFTVDHRQPGALCDALRVFKDNSINLTRIDSRPDALRNARSGLWHYVFFVEFLGNARAPRTRAALRLLEKICIDLKVLGSYPIVKS